MVYTSGEGEVYLFVGAVALWIGLIYYTVAYFIAASKTDSKNEKAKNSMMGIICMVCFAIYNYILYLYMKKDNKPKYYYF